MNASNVQTASSRTDWHLDPTCGLPSRFLKGDPNIDDPVNDPGLGRQRGDSQLSDEFACLLSLICKEGGEFS